MSSLWNASICKVFFKNSRSAMRVVSLKNHVLVLKTWLKFYVPFGETAGSGFTSFGAAAYQEQLEKPKAFCIP